MNLTPSEHSEQVAFVKWFRLQFPDVGLFAVPNGGARNKAVAAKLKAEGVSPGVPDLFIPAWRLFVEMKRRKGGRLSPEQSHWMQYLTQCGYTCIVCHGLDDAISAIRRFASEVN